MLLDLDEQSLALQLLDQVLAADEPVLPGVGARACQHAAVVRDDLDLGQIVAQAALEVFGVVGRRHLHHAGPELPVHVGVGDDGNLAPHHRQEHPLSHQRPEPLVFGMDRHRGVPQHGLWARRGHNHLACARHQRVADVPEFSVALVVLYLQIRERRSAAGAPVDDVIPAIDQPRIVEPAEHFPHRVRQARIQREALPLPVARSAQRLELPDDGPARLALPLPDSLDEGLASHILPRETLLPELSLHHVLRRDPGVIRAGHPERAIPPHPMPADEDVLQRAVEGMPHMQRAGHVGGRDDNAVGGAGRGLVRVEQPLLFPESVPALLHAVRVVPLLSRQPRVGRGRGLRGRRIVRYGHYRLRNRTGTPARRGRSVPV